MEQIEAGGLRALYEPGLEPGSPVMVLFHGFGANAADLAPLASELRRAGIGTEAHWYFPDGFVSAFGPGSRCWWMLDQAAVEAALATGTIRDQSTAEPPGLPEARQRAQAFLQALLDERGHGGSPLHLGGFSQGAMLSTDLTLHGPLVPTSLTILSGTLLNREGWQSLAGARTGLPFFQSHGSADPLLGPALAQQLFELLQSAGLVGEFVSFEGGHDIPRSVLEGWQAFLGRVGLGS